MERGWLWAIVLTNCLVLVGWGSEPKLTPRLPELLVDPLPMRLEAPPAPEARTDTLGWRTGGVRYSLAVPRTPYAPTRREFLCYNLTLEKGLSRLPLFEWWAMGENSSLPAPVNPRGVAVLIVGDLVGGFEFLKRIKYAPVTLPTSPALSVESQRFPLTPVYLRPEQLPDTPLALLGVPFIVLMDGAERLSEAQMRALVLWLHAGGQLIVTLGASAPLLRRTQLAPYLPAWDEVRLQRLQHPLHLSRTGAQVLPPREPVPAAWLSHPRGAPLVQVGDRTLAIETQWGFGRLMVIGSDLTHSAWRRWRGQATLWAALLHRPRFPLLQLAQLTGTPERDSKGRDQVLAAALWLGVILTVYWASLYALWRTLRAQRRLVYAPYGVAALAGLTLIALHFATPEEPKTAPYNSRRVILGVGAHAIERAECLCRLPSGEWTLTWQGADALAVEPTIAPNPIQVAFTSEGATLRSHSFTPSTLTLRTLTQSPAPLRLQRTRDGYELRNISEDLTLEVIAVKSYPRSSSPGEAESADDMSKWETNPPLATWRLALNQSVPFPYEPSVGYLVRGSAKVATEQRTETVEIWLFYP